MIFSLLAGSQQAVLFIIVQSKLRFFYKNQDYILFQENNIFINFEITVLETSMFPVYNIITAEAASYFEAAEKASWDLTKFGT
jgi:hypothetical protein